MPLSNITAVIIDLDGTLVDTLGDFEVALNHTLADLGLPPVGRALIGRTVGKGSEHLVRSVLAHQMALPEVLSGGSVALTWPQEQVFDLALQRYQHHYRFTNGQYAAVYPGAAEGLQRLRAAGFPLACLTNKPLAFAQDLLDIKGLAGHFAQVFGGDSFERKKPDPLPIIKTCEALGSEPGRTLMVGDSQNDAQAARAAGCAVALVTYGYNHGDPIANAPHDLLADSLDAIALALLA
ncbi:MAG: phosphoglycolate phosphatase [Hydrogenophaga sp.]